MKKRVLSAIVAGILLVGTMLPSIEVSATPNTEVEQARSEYEELTNKINEINEKIQKLDSEISPLVIKMNDNETEISNINTQIDNTNKEIDQAKTEISDQEEVLGNRLREVYKSGGELSYLNIIFSANSLSDLISKINSAKRVVELDNEIIESLNEKKDKLDKKVESLQAKSDEIEKLNEEIATQKKELEEKKAEQETLVQNAKDERAKFESEYLAPYEREIVQGFMATAKNSNSSIDDLKSAIETLRSIRDGQIKSPVVVEEINAAIETAKNLVTQKEQEEERRAAEAAAANNSTTSRGDSSSTGVTATGTAAAVLSEAYKHLGKPYVWGATGPNSFDCSGFTSYVYSKATGIYIGRTTYNQINAGVEVSYSELQPGDLVFPHSGHVGIYIGNGQMIHAPQTGDVIKVSSVYKFWRARRILN